MKEDKKYLEEQSDAVGSIVPVTKAEGETLAKKIKAQGYFETSSLRREGIEEVKQAIITDINTITSQNTLCFKNCTLL